MQSLLKHLKIQYCFKLLKMFKLTLVTKCDLSKSDTLKSRQKLFKKKKYSSLRIPNLLNDVMSLRQHLLCSFSPPPPLSVSIYRCR